jgi:hypothetical protein
LRTLKSTGVPSDPSKPLVSIDIRNQVAEIDRYLMLTDAVTVATIKETECSRRLQSMDRPLSLVFFDWRYSPYYVSMLPHKVVGADGKERNVCSPVKPRDLITTYEEKSNDFSVYSSHSSTSW